MSSTYRSWRQTVRYDVDVASGVIANSVCRAETLLRGYCGKAGGTNSGINGPSGRSSTEQNSSIYTAASTVLMCVLDHGRSTTKSQRAEAARPRTACPGNDVHKYSDTWSKGIVNDILLGVRPNIRTYNAVIDSHGSIPWWIPWWKVITAWHHGPWMEVGDNNAARKRAPTGTERLNGGDPGQIFLYWRAGSPSLSTMASQKDRDRTRNIIQR